MLTALSQLNFRKAYIAEGNDINQLNFRTPLYPIVPITCFVLCLVVIVSMAFVDSLRAALYCGLPFAIGCYAYYYLRIHKKIDKEKDTIILKRSSGE